MTVAQRIAIDPPVPTAATASDIAINCDVKKIYYGSFLAVRDSQVPIHKG